MVPSTIVVAIVATIMRECGDRSYGCFHKKGAKLLFWKDFFHFGEDFGFVLILALTVLLFCAKEMIFDWLLSLLL